MVNLVFALGGNIALIEVEKDLGRVVDQIRINFAPSPKSRRGQ